MRPKNQADMDIMSNLSREYIDNEVSLLDKLFNIMIEMHIDDVDAWTRQVGTKRRTFFWNPFKNICLCDKHLSVRASRENIAIIWKKNKMLLEAFALYFGISSVADNIVISDNIMQDDIHVFATFVYKKKYVKLANNFLFAKGAKVLAPVLRYSPYLKHVAFSLFESLCFSCFFAP